MNNSLFKIFSLVAIPALMLMGMPVSTDTPK